MNFPRHRKENFKQQSKSKFESLALALRDAIIDTACIKGLSLDDPNKINIDFVVLSETLEKHGFVYRGSGSNEEELKANKKRSVKESFNQLFSYYVKEHNDLNFLPERFMLNSELCSYFAEQLKNKKWEYQKNKKV